jgi:hypothetical protein
VALGRELGLPAEFSPFSFSFFFSQVLLSLSIPKIQYIGRETQPHSCIEKGGREEGHKGLLSGVNFYPHPTLSVSPKATPSPTPVPKKWFFVFCIRVIPNADAALGVRDYWCRLLTVYALVFPVSQFTPVGLGLGLGLGGLGLG